MMIYNLSQLLRNHLNNQELAWTRQKTFHLLVGMCNSGFLIHFVLTSISMCSELLCWSHGLGLVIMGFPQLLFLAIFLLLLSFWIDLCHETSDDDEDDTGNYNEALLDKRKSKQGLRHVESHRRCCSCEGFHVGSRQKIVIMVIVLAFLVILAISIFIWSGSSKCSIDSLLIKKAYLDIYSLAIFLLGAALTFYGLLLISKMSKIRSETVSSDKWKVSSLAVVSLVCFTTSSVIALATNVPVLPWEETQSDTVMKSVLLFLYYFIGSLIPSAFVLWVMRDITPRQVLHRPVRPQVVTTISDQPTASQSQWRTAVASSVKPLKGSPI